MLRNKYLIHVSWEIELSPALAMLKAAEPRTHKTFVVEATEQPSEVVIKKIARVQYEDYNNTFVLHAITKLDPKYPVAKFHKLDENPIDVD
jgi:hypothetical protein